MGMNGGVLYDLRQRTKEEYHVLDGEVVLDIIHFFEDLDVDFWILEGATRYTNRTSIETQEHSTHCFNRTTRSNPKQNAVLFQF